MNRNQLPSVQGEFAFALRPGEESVAEAETPLGYSYACVNRKVTIRDARPIANELSLEREGFKTVAHKISCANERDPEVLRRKYLEEMAPFIHDYFKASWVTTVDLGGVALRTVGAEEAFFRTDEGTDKRLVRAGGAGFVHIDYAPVSGPMIAARDTQLLGQEIRPYSRLMIIQAWRALSPPPQSFPVAFCDSSSIRPEDVLETPFDKYGVKCKVSVLHHNPEQRWYYFPEMTADEFILFKGYDSKSHDRPWSAHAAFDNRAAYPHAKPRSSIECRFYVYDE
jgi:hypothetical protein